MNNDAVRELEVCLVGALLQAPELLADPAIRAVRPGDFCEDGPRAAYAEICRRYDAGEPVDVALVAAAVGPVIDWSMAVALCPRPGNAALYAEEIAHQARRRRLAAACLSASADLERGADPVQAMTAVRDAEKECQPVEDVSIAAALEDLREYQDRSAQGLTLLPSGFRALDKLMGGFAPGRLYIVAARPGVGKTTFALNLIARNLGAPSLLVSLELPRSEAVAKLVGIMKRRTLSEVLDGTVREIPPELSASRLRISEKAASADAIRALVRPGDRLLIVDQFSFLKPPEGRYASSFEAASEVVHRMKELARERQIPVVLIAQLSRAKKPGEPPQLSDLKLTGSLEEDADGVLLLDREQGGDTLFCSLAKTRQGPPGDFSLRFYGPTGVISE